MSAWRVLFTPQAKKDARNLAAAGLRAKAASLLEILAADPYTTPPHFEKLVGDLAGAYSRRINRQHRLVYQILPNERIVKIIRLWGHYDS